MFHYFYGYLEREPWKHSHALWWKLLCDIKCEMKWSNLFYIWIHEILRLFHIETLDVTMVIFTSRGKYWFSFSHTSATDFNFICKVTYRKLSLRTMHSILLWRISLLDKCFSIRLFMYLSPFLSNYLPISLFFSYSLEMYDNVPTIEIYGKQNTINYTIAAQFNIIICRKNMKLHYKSIKQMLWLKKEIHYLYVYSHSCVN